MCEEDHHAPPAGLSRPEGCELDFGTAGGRIHPPPLQRGIVAGGPRAAAAAAGGTRNAKATLGGPLGAGRRGWLDARAAGRSAAGADAGSVAAQLIMIHKASAARYKPACVVGESEGRHFGAAAADWWLPGGDRK